jgi:L-rhamnose mutarotase
MREARDWFGTNFKPTSMEEAYKLIPMGSKENAYFRMVVSYWEMAASFVTSGVLNQDLFLQTNGELLFVWERVRQIAPAFREMMKNPEAWKNLETVANAFIENMKSKSPDAYAAFQAMVASVSTPPQKSSGAGS